MGGEVFERNAQPAAAATKLPAMSAASGQISRPEAGAGDDELPDHVAGIWARFRAQNPARNRTRIPARTNRLLCGPGFRARFHARIPGAKTSPDSGNMIRVWAALAVDFRPRNPPEIRQFDRRWRSPLRPALWRSSSGSKSPLGLVLCRFALHRIRNLSACYLAFDVSTDDRAAGRTYLSSAGPGILDRSGMLPGQEGRAVVAKPSTDTRFFFYI